MQPDRHISAKRLPKPADEALYRACADAYHPHQPSVAALIAADPQFRDAIDHAVRVAGHLGPDPDQMETADAD